MRRIYLFTKIVPLFVTLLLVLSAQPVYSQKYKKNKSGYPEFVWWSITYPNGSVGLSVNDKKNIVVKDFMTNIDGVFAGGDVIGGLLQVSKAVSDGANAAVSIKKYIESRK